jgi:ribonuclease P protein component
MRTIRSTREIDEIFRSARKTAGPLAIALVAATETGRDHNGRVAFVAGKKIGNAVKRNRAKRVLREAARASGAPWAGFDVVLIARPATVAASGTEVIEAVRQLMVRSEVLR